jgi:glutaredoxin-related protein
MKMMKRIIFLLILIFLGTFLFSYQVSAQEIEINFFYSETCLHCAAEQKFLDTIEQKYPQVQINRHPVSQVQCQKELIDLCKKYNIEQYIGLVPLTFVGEEFFLGFDNPEDMGQKIEDSIQNQLKGLKKPGQNQEKINLPIIGEIDISKYSLPVLAVILGTLDGFNICSLGALVLILGLVLALRSRRKILIFGGIFILTTAVIYGLLIVLWHQLFSLFAPYQRVMTILIGIIGVGGGIYFLKEFIKFRKQGPVCETVTGKTVAKLSSKMQETLKHPEKIFAVIAAVLLFAAVITLVEFPCSAAIPVVFAGILAKAQLAPSLFLLYISLFVVFYMLDEILIFLIALSTLKLWLASPKFVTWITLVEAIILFAFGLYYLIGF